MKLNSDVLVPTAAAIRLDTGMTGRRRIAVSNAGPNPIYLGPDNTVAVGKGIVVPTGQTLVLEGMDEINSPQLWARAATALQVTGAATNVLEW